MNNNVEFIEDGHIYLNQEGVRLPSVTQIIDHFYPKFYKNGLHKEKGTAIHWAAELWDKGKLDWSSLDDRIVPQVTAYVDFVNSSGFKSLLIEQPMSIDEPENLRCFAGKPDRIGKLGEEFCVLDIKCSDGVIKTTDIQTAMYALLHKDNYKMKEIVDRYTVYLRSNGKFKLKQFKDDDDYIEAEAMIFLYNRLLEKGVIKEL